MNEGALSTDRLRRIPSSYEGVTNPSAAAQLIAARPFQFFNSP